MTRNVPPRYFLIGLVPAAMAIIESIITKQFLTANLPISTELLSPDNGFQETTGRFRFLGATWFFAALALLVFVMAIRDLAQPIARQTRFAAILVLVGVFALAVYPTVDYALNPDKLRNYHRLGGDLFEAALARGGLPGCASPEDRWLLGLCGEVPVISLLNRMMDVTNVFAGLGVGGLVVGMVLCLEEQPDTDLDAQAAQLERNMQRMRRQLYMSGLVLTFGMFFAISWMRWLVPMVDGADAAAYGALVSSALLFVGIYFSLLILSFYLPVALILEGRKQRLSDAAAQEESLADYKAHAAWLKMRGLQTNPIEFLKSGFALAAPILAAFAGSFPSLL
ncbi:hypothetical protein [Loktanella sp. Alg231-35]|uniref:hypothetical protein n=1 Tax=Loktanella sp. Alg231-35 TaxID=1922220 RepID=UPI000D55439C|nr:hypothetical protein [Loktanella sp. Alg231-35]